MALCESCGKRVDKKDPHGIPWLHGKCAAKLREKEHARPILRDYDRIIQEYGGKELSKTAEGRSVIQNARQKYRAELIQPGEPGFKEYWGRDVERREKDMAELRHDAAKARAEKGWV